MYTICRPSVLSGLPIYRRLRSHGTYPIYDKNYFLPAIGTGSTPVGDVTTAGSILLYQSR